ncbi:MAG: hypothetical protein ORN27_08655 [Rhodoluna sp.]|nr:hypothetical protein [Rhodoluna sp.]
MFTKALLSITAAVSLFAAGTLSAVAAPTSLSLNEFLSSAGYQVLAAEGAATANFLSNQTGVRITSVATATSNGTEVSHIETELLSTNSASSATIKSFENGLQVGSTWGTAQANGYVYEPVSTALVRPDLKNGAAALARLGKSSAASVRMTKAVAGVEFVPYSPSEILGGSQIDPLSWLNDNTSGADLSAVSGLKFSEVTSGLDVDNSGLTDFSFTATIPATDLLPATDIDFVIRYNANHIFQDESISMTVGAVTVTSTTTLETVAQLTLPTTWADNAVDWAALLAMGKRISAEKLVATKASAIAAKALAAAKKAKKTLVASYITAAAKALKYSVTAVRNGVKLSAKYQGQTGSVCVTAVRGKVVKANC